MVIAPVCKLVAGLALLAVVPPFCGGAGPDDKDVGRLTREVAERERQLTRTERDLAEARARLVLAEGKREVAAAELHKAIERCQRDVQWVRDHSHWFCHPREPLTGAKLGLVTDRAWLAEVEGDTVALVAECQKLVGLQGQRLQAMRRLERAKAVDPADVDLAQMTFDKSQGRLEVAVKQLSAERQKKPGKPR